MNDQSVDLADDLLIGAAAIADWIGVSPRAVYGMRERGHPAISHEPGLGVVARKSRLAQIGLTQPTASGVASSSTRI